MQMRKARAAYGHEHLVVAEVLDDDGKVKSRAKMRMGDAPSFKQWARDRFRNGRGQQVVTGKLAKIVAAAEVNA
jgi:hypothetical protein